MNKLFFVFFQKIYIFIKILQKIAVVLIKYHIFAN